MKRISVVILSYNNLVYLFDALDSVIVQDYPDYEVIVSDDGSSDFLASDIEEYIGRRANKNCKRMLVLSTAENVGTVKNLNKAILCAQGDYIVPMAADDVLHNLGVLTKFAEAFKYYSEPLIITTQVAQYDVELRELLKYTLSERQIKLLSSRNASEIYGELCVHSFLPAGGTAYRRELFEQYGLFDETYRLVEDWPFSLKLTRLGETFNFSDFISLKHRDGGVSRKNFTSPTQKQYQADLIRVIEKEILPHLYFAPIKVQKDIRTLCMDKMAIYSFRYKFKNKTFKGKCSWLLKTKALLPVLFRGLRRRMFQYE